MFPTVLFMTKKEFPSILEVDEKGNYTLDKIDVKPPYNFLYGVSYEYLILVFPQKSLSKIDTIFHEILHWVNYKIGDFEWIDRVIDLEIRKIEEDEQNNA